MMRKKWKRNRWIAAAFLLCALNLAACGGKAQAEAEEWQESRAEEEAKSDMEGEKDGAVSAETVESVAEARLEEPESVAAEDAADAVEPQGSESNEEAGPEETELEQQEETEEALVWDGRELGQLYPPLLVIYGELVGEYPDYYEFRAKAMEFNDRGSYEDDVTRTLIRVRKGCWVGYGGEEMTIEE